MINTLAEHKRVLVSQLGHDPRYANSIHDDRPAQGFGFRGALVGGGSVTSYMTHLFVEAWGEDWLRRGTFAQRSRRPVYDGVTVTATATPIRREASGLVCDVVLRDEAGEELASVTGGLPDQAATPPDLAAFPHRPTPASPRPIEPGGFAAGDLIYSTETPYTEAVHADYLARVRETLPIYLHDQVAHSGYMLTLIMRDGNTSYKRPTPGVHVSVTGQNFNIGHVGDVFSTSGRITGAFERKGNHYMEAEQLVIANHRTPIALFRRVAIYALRPKA
jgi:hypothetical protein